MLKNSIGAACAAVLVALAGGLATPTASHAAIYGGVFDPENAFYKWSGTHRFEVSDACLAQSNGWYEATSNGTCDVRLIGGSLTVKNIIENVEETIDLATFDFMPSKKIWGIYVENKELVGVDSKEIGAFTFGSPALGGDWTLQWVSGLCPGNECNGTSGLPAAPNGGAVFLSNSQKRPIPPMSLPPTFQRLNGPTAIPEPTTVTLVLAAMGAGWLARRRKR